MVTLDRLAEIASALPSVTEGERHGNRTWSVEGKVFAWERSFSKADLRRFGDDTPPAGPIVAVVTEDLHEKEAILAEAAPGFFTIPHFDGYPAVLMALRQARTQRVREAVRDAWLACAPEPMVERFLAR
jgi:hypothetical protein